MWRIVSVFLISVHCILAQSVTRTCKRANEVYVDCPTAQCSPGTCANLGLPFSCQTTSGKNCSSRPGCVCRDGYLRNQNGVCIPAGDCPSCGGDVNARSGCGSNCGKRCSDLGRSEPIFCTLQCRLYGCECKNGFYYDEVNKKCVLPSECTNKPQCKENEIFVDCPDSMCDPKNCSEVGFPVACATYQTCPSKPGCVCRSGYVRDSNGACVAASTCPSCGGDPNAKVGCGTNCGKRCTDLGRSEPSICPLGCRLYGCDCKDGFYLNEAGKCVLPNQCNQTMSSTTSADVSASNQPQCPDATVKKLLDGIAKFTFTFLKEAYKKAITKSDKGSMVMSAASVFIPIGELALYAVDNTYTQLITALNLETKEDIRCAFPVLANQLKGNENVTLNLAAKVYSTDMYPLTQNFNRDTRNVFSSEAQSVNFNNKQETADIINQWGNWSTKFDEAATVPRDFYVNNVTTIEVPTMVVHSDFRYAEDTFLDCKVLQMSYLGGDFSFIVMLPNKNDGLSAMIDQLATPEAFYNAVNSMTTQDVVVLLPKMKIESSYNLAEIMTAAGMVDIFDRKKSRLDNVLVQYEPLFISAAVQKAFIEVTEKGTEAAAANTIGVSAITSVQPTKLPKIFQADHPYAYFIMKNGTCRRANEVYVDCPTAQCSPGTCANLGRPFSCENVSGKNCSSKPGCVCRGGYLRNRNGACIPAGDCQPQCKENEIFVDCPDSMCDPKNCSEVGFPVACATYQTCPSKPGCVCRSGYVRDSDGACVAASTCPSCGGDPNAEVGCGTNCGKRCTDLGKSEPSICPLGCRLYGCDCKDGFYLNGATGKCVLPNQCNQTVSTNPVDDPTNTQPKCSEATVKNLLEGITKFTLFFLKKAYDTEMQKREPKNTVMSAASVFIPMGELGLYARDDTYNQLMATLNLQTKENIRCAFPSLANQLKGNENVTLNLAAKVYSTDKYPLAQNFFRDTRNIFGSEAQSVNFSNAQETTDIINSWVAGATNNRIKDIAKPYMFSSGTRLVLANAIYFLGNWSTKFDEADTAPRDFYLSNFNSIQIPTMQVQSNFNYAENTYLDCKVLQMLYLGGDFSFVVFLPNEKVGLSAMMDKLTTPDTFYNAVNSMKIEDVVVSLPKMKIESSYDLKEIMIAAGMTDIFDPEKSKLEDVLEKYEPLYVGAAVQKAFIEVTEKGTEAAASNQKCGTNERNVDCPATMCIAQRCSQLGFPIPCPIVGPGRSCPNGPGCICESGYLRNNTGQCIPIAMCPSCGGDPNARMGCGYQCAQKCTKNLLKTPIPCPCQLNGCQCKNGYIYDEIHKKCVKPDKCPSCGGDVNAKPGCGTNYGKRCSDLRRSNPPKCPLKCKRFGCDCIEGLYLDEVTGKCVLPSECTNKPQCSKNEMFVDCPDNECQPKDCSEVSLPKSCVMYRKCPSKPGCVCVKGTVRDSSGTCVSTETCKNSNTPQPQPCSDATLETLLKGSAEFTGNILSEAYKENPTSNMVISPISIFIPMGELASRAENNTFTQLMKALNLQTKDDIRCAFPSLTRELRGDSNVILNLAARIFTTDKSPLMRNFRDDTKSIFNAEAESINFLNREAAASRINQWVEDQTNNRIKDIANPDMFDESTRLVLANAIYFLGNWQHQFDGNDTSDRDFHVNSQTTVRIPTMYQQRSFKYAEISSLDCKVLEMPYKGDNFSFFVLLPNQIDGLANLIEKIKSSYEFNGAYDNTRYEKVNVYLPKIKIESEFNLKTIMQKLGITDIFDSNKSRLIDILEQYEPLYVSTAIQKAFIEVTETGTEAAAANIFIAAGGGAAVGNPPPVYDFRADHPFVYFILHKRDILFTGVMCN
ncbi:hypothetical protein ACJJTC_019646 [Scirpophaga incertulas]